MYPILWQWGDLLFASWHVFYALGAILAYFTLQAISRKYYSEIGENDLVKLYLVVYVAGYFGARLLSVFVEQHDIVGVFATLRALFAFGPMTFYGGALAAVFSGMIFTWYKKLPTLKLLDVSMPAGMLALAVGRIGCFLNGDDYGKEIPVASGVWRDWLGVVFPNLQDGIVRYPIQLFEAGWAILLVVLAWLVLPKLKKRPGFTGFLLIYLYAVGRLVLEIYRGDERGWVVNQLLSTSQFISLLIIVSTSLMIAVRRILFIKNLKKSLPALNSKNA